MLKQRLVGFLVIASILAIFLPYLYYNQNPFPSASPVVIPREPKPVGPEKEFSQLKADIEQSFQQSVTQNTRSSSPLHEKAWSIQLASFSQAANAGALVQKLRAGGFAAYQQVRRQGDETPHFRVCVGPVLTLEKAKQLKAQIAKQPAFQTLEGVIIAFRPLSTGGEDGDF